MMMLSRILTALPTVIASPAMAASISDTANDVSNGLMPVFATTDYDGFAGIAAFLRDRIFLIIAPIGLLLVVRAGLRLINSQDEDKLTKAKNTIAATCVGIMLAFLSDKMVQSFYAPGGAWNETTSRTGATILSAEILGILNWASTFIAILGVLMIIVAALKTVSTFGGEDTAPLKRSVTGLATGLLVIMTSGAIKAALGLPREAVPIVPTGGNPGEIIARGMGIIIYLLSFTGLVAMGVIVYAGIMMVISWGNEDQYGKSKSLIIRSCIGLAIMVLSGVAVVFIGSLLI